MCLFHETFHPFTFKVIINTHAFIAIFFLLALYLPSSLFSSPVIWWLYFMLYLDSFFLFVLYLFFYYIFCLWLPWGFSIAVHIYIWLFLVILIQTIFFSSFCLNFSASVKLFETSYFFFKVASFYGSMPIQSTCTQWLWWESWIWHEHKSHLLIVYWLLSPS